MPAATKVDDGTVGTCNPGLPCCPHGRAGTNKKGSPDVFINDKPAHRVTDTGPCNCPHGGTFISEEGSENVFVNDLKLTRIGDLTVCMDCGESGNHDTGSENVFVN